MDDFGGTTIFGNTYIDTPVTWWLYKDSRIMVFPSLASLLILTRPLAEAVPTLVLWLSNRQLQDASAKNWQSRVKKLQFFHGGEAWVQSTWMILGCLFFFMHCKGERIFFSIYSLFTLNKYMLRIPSPLSSVRLSISRSFRSTYQDWWDGSAVWGPQHIFWAKNSRIGLVG